jgi:DNA repair exonuclease SbcCD nuclease subunit
VNNKTAVITDLHFGVRNNHPYFLKRQQQFFEEVFFPTIDAEEIDTVIDMGDVFDKQSNVKFSMLSEASKFYFDEIKKRNLDYHIIVGNHDIPYRNTTLINSPDILLRKAYGFKVYDSPEEVTIKGKTFCFIPWITVENQQEAFQLIEDTNCKYLFGHLAIVGATMYRGIKNEHGLDRVSLAKFEKVFSGHFHYRSTEDNIWYLGNPYETTWSDYDNKKGFHIFDVNDGSIRMVENPQISHVMVSKVEDVTEEKLADMIVKVDLTNMTDDEVTKVYKKIDKFQNRPQSILFINKTNFSEIAEANTEDLAVTTTKDILIDYVKSMESEDKKYDSLSKLLVETYDKAIEIL